jgi:hypothetical protein
MDLVRNIALAALLFLIFIVLTSNRSFGDTGEHAKALAAAASDEAAIKRIESEDARRLAEVRRVKLARAKKDELARRCRIKPVMSDGEIESCRVAYRDLGSAAE